MSFGDRTVTLSEDEVNFLQSVLLAYENEGRAAYGRAPQLLNSILGKIEDAPAAQ